MLPPVKDKKILETLDSFTNLSVVKIVGTACIAFCVFWLNSSYVRTDVFRVVGDKVSALEMRVTSTERQINDLSPILRSIEKRLSIVITEDGKILYDSKITGMERDISLIQKDIEYIKDNLKSDKFYHSASSKDVGSQQISGDSFTR